MAARSTTDNIPTKPTFAKVSRAGLGRNAIYTHANSTLQIVASSYTSQDGKTMSVIPKPSQKDAGSNGAAKSQPLKILPSPNRVVMASPTSDCDASADSSHVAYATNDDKAKSVPGVNGKQHQHPTVRTEDGAVKSATNDDGSTQLSSDGSGKPQSFDTKSVASGTTFAMDEKESLRPDDSASMRAAIEEEETFSAPGSVVNGSRVGSDIGSRTFREQFQDIPYVNIVSIRAGQQAVTMSTAAALPSLAETSPLNHPVTSDTQSSPNHVNVPDEKLLDALQSQRDRVWVLKLEQDIIDFVGQSKYVAQHFSAWYDLPSVC
jgi:hypothetical protein